jgi:hypothetical protein
MNCRYYWLWAAAALALGAAWWHARVPRQDGPLAQEAYVWQRAWTDSVRTAVEQHGAEFSGLVVLQAEITWEKGRPRIHRVPLDQSSLRATGRPIGLALRIGPYSGPFSSEGELARMLAFLAASMIEEARSKEINVSELQIDFDCAESKLDDYRVWVKLVRDAVAPTPVVITALPSWLDRRAFRRLAREADGYVLQVHSLDRPRHPGIPFQLCDPIQARRAIERAGRIGLPFRVALPTYAYLVAFDERGKFVGIAAEAPPTSWAGEARVQEVRSDPALIAGLVRGWTARRPAALQGILWYRLPVGSDRLNWSWPMLKTVMAGTIPESKLVVRTAFPEPGLLEVAFANEGDADAILDRPVVLAWPGARMIAGDGLAGFQLRETGNGGAEFAIDSGHPAARLAPGQRRAMGWVRLDQTVKVHHETTE